MRRAPSPPGFPLLCGLLALCAALALPPPAAELPEPARVPGEDLGPAGHNCRFWALVGHDYPAGLLDEHLRNPGATTLRSLGAYNQDGWGIVSFPSDSALRRALLAPLARRGRPRTAEPDDPNFAAAVEELGNLRPRAILGHVRAATSGVRWIPNPHPFVRDGWAFAHNGGIAGDLLLDLLEGDDPDFLTQNLPEYAGPGAPSQHIDSELYFLWVLKHGRLHPELSRTEAIRQAAAAVHERAPEARINFILTRGDTLWALRCAAYDQSDPVRFYPAGTDSSPYWAVASQPVGTDGARWGTIPAATLGVFVPGEPPSFYSVETPAPAVFSLARIAVTGGQDADGDGYVREFTVRCDPDASHGAHEVFLRVLRRGEEVSETLAESGPLPMSAGSVETLRVACPLPDGQPPDAWDLRLELVGADGGPPVAVADPESHPDAGLAGVKIEGAAHDDPEQPPPPVPEGLRPRPNPTRGEIWIPITAPVPGQPVELEVWSASGARVRQDADPVLAPGGGPGSALLAWDGRDASGRAVPAGAYWCRARVGDRVTARQVTVVH